MRASPNKNPLGTRPERSMPKKTDEAKVRTCANSLMTCSRAGGVDNEAKLPSVEDKGHAEGRRVGS
eukprot:scaffold116423_cov29-Tisochrysis_lutea.AAC.3